MKKQLRITSLIGLITLMLFSFSGCESELSQLDVELTIGFQGAVKISEGNPVRASIINNGDEFNGELQVIVNQNDMESIIYAKEFQIPENGEKDIQLAIPVYTIQREFEVKIVEGNKTAFEDKVSVSRFISPFQPVVAVISDQPDNYKFFNASQFSQYQADDIMVDTYYNSSSSDMVEAKQEVEVFYFDDFEEISKMDNLEFFNYFYIGDHSNLKIGSQLEEDILQWVNNGGSLFLETGEDYKRLYSFLPESITNFSVDEIKTVHKDTIFEKYELQESVQIATGRPIDSTNVGYYNENGLDLAMYTNHGSGQIINLLMDLSQPALNDKSYRSRLIDEFLLRGVNGSDKVVGTTYQYGNDGRYTYMLRYIPSEKKPPYIVMAIVFSVYILMAGPILYIILKQRDKRDLMWVAIPAASIICLLILYIFGFGTRYNEPILNSISTIEYVDGENYLDVYSEIAVFNNEGGDLKVDWASSESLENINDYYNYYNQSSSRDITGKITSGNRNVYEIYDTSLWENVNFKSEKTIPIQTAAEGTFISIDLTEDEVTLNIFNKTPFDLETSYVKWGNSYGYIGELASMEHKEIAIDMTDMSSNLNTLLDQVRRDEGIDRYSRNSFDSELNSNLELLENSSDRYYGWEETLNLSFDEIQVVGINKSPIGYDILVNDVEPETFNKNIFTVTTQVEFTAGTKLNLPAGFVSPEFLVSEHEGSNSYKGYVENRGYDDQGLFVYGERFIEATYTIPEYVEVEALRLKVYPVFMEHEYYERNEFNNNNSLTDVDYEIYNYQTEQYDKITDIESFFNVDIDKYLMDNQLVFVYRINEIETDQYMNGHALQVPELAVEGRAN